MNYLCSFGVAMECARHQPVALRWPNFVKKCLDRFDADWYSFEHLSVHIRHLVTPPPPQQRSCAPSVRCSITFPAARISDYQASTRVTAMNPTPKGLSNGVRQARPNVDEGSDNGFAIDRLPKTLQKQFRALYEVRATGSGEHLRENQIHTGDARDLLKRIRPNSISLSFWSPPYFVGKAYEQYLTFEKWKILIAKVLALHFDILKPGGFVVVNIADILAFKDESMPRIQADVVTGKRSGVTRENVVEMMKRFPNLNRQAIAKKLGCSEQTVDRRLNGNNIRGGKHEPQTRVQIVGGLVDGWARAAGLYIYDRRAWVKDPAWENCRWHSSSFRSVDEFEYLYFLWKPGIVKFDRNRLSSAEWRDWGSRAVWNIRSVRSSDDHEAKFPVELAFRVIRLLTDPGDTVLDCFMGSGTTAEAAIRTGRKFLGIERLRQYVTLANSRIQALLPLSPHVRSRPH